MWRYYKGSSSPPVQGALNWTQPGYSDSGWGPASPSGFGYGDGDDATEFGDMQNNYRSIFVRHTFNINPAGITQLTVGIDFDDGCVLYLNGTEVARLNMPGGVIDHLTFASNGREASRGGGADTPQERQFVAIDPALLVNGDNVFAVSGHNSSVGSSDLTLVPELYKNVTLLRGPFLQMPNAGQISVVWRTDALTDSAIDYGTDANYTGGTVTDAALVRQHMVTLPALPPNTTIHYRVRSGGVTLAEETLQTPRAANQPFRFSVYGDFGWSDAPGVLAHAPTTAIATRVNSSNPHLTLTVGDNIYSDGQPGLYDPSWFVPYAAINRRVPLFPALGNHDVNNSTNGSYYLNNFYLPENGPSDYIERSYSFDYGNAHFAVVDSNPFAQNNAVGMTAVRDWLEADLAAATNLWKIVVLHHPPYTSDGGSTHGDEENVKAQLVPLFAQYGVQIVFQGHNHFYERTNAINGVYYLMTGGGGRSLHSPTNRKEYSARVFASDYSFTIADLDGTRLSLTQVSQTGATIDSFELDIGHPFRIDGLIDDTNWQRAENGLRLYAAIRGNYLYVATQDAGEGSDHFIYVHNQADTLRMMHWAKSGQVMQWGAFVADENDNAFQGWYNPAAVQTNNSAVYRSMTSGLNNNAPSSSGVLEGTIDLATHFGAFPAQVHLAAAPYSTGNTGGLITSAQVPAGDGDGDLEANEFLVLNTRDIALDLPVSVAGPDQTIEAGMTVTLSSAGSSAPSGLPLSFAWSQLSGPAVVIGNAGSPIANFAPSSNVAEATDLVFRLRVNDTRFDTDDMVTIQLYPMVDSDGDGLSNQEELTGNDNVLTSANPVGKMTDPDIADSDGDGMNDGNEAIAGTDPTSANSVFRVSEIERDGAGVHLSWPSISGRVYHLQRSGAMSSGWVDIGGEITASSAMATGLDPSPAPEQPFYRVRFVR